MGKFTLSSVTIKVRNHYGIEVDCIVTGKRIGDLLVHRPVVYDNQVDRGWTVSHIPTTLVLESNFTTISQARLYAKEFDRIVGKLQPIYEKYHDSLTKEDYDKIKLFFDTYPDFHPTAMRKKAMGK